MGTARSSALDILKLLDRSNCRECGVPTCLAFAAAVAQGQRALSDCPHVEAEVVDRFEDLTASRQADDTSRDVSEVRGTIEQLVRDVARVDYSDAAERLGGALKGDCLAVPCLGRIFELDEGGQLHAQCHVNQWVHAPLLEYVIFGVGKDPQGDWVHFNELQGTASWVPFFAHRCEGAIKRIVDDYHDLFFDIMSLFEAEPPNISDDLEADWALVIYPLPKVPLLICYWKAEDEFPSKLSVLYDRSTNVNLPPGAVFSITQAIAQMLAKMVTKHSLEGL